MSRKPIILIGAASGAGKSTLARNLAAAMKLNHMIGTGFIREIVKTETTAEADSELFSYSSQVKPGGGPVDTLIAQSKRLHSAVTACIERAHREGTALVIEGAHIIPELYHAQPLVDAFIVLEAPDPDRHHQRVLGPSHLYREVSKDDFAHIRAINDYYMAEAKRLNLPTVIYDDNLEAILASIS